MLKDEELNEELINLLLTPSPQVEISAAPIFNEVQSKALQDNKQNIVETVAEELEEETLQVELDNEQAVEKVVELSALDPQPEQEDEIVTLPYPSRPTLSKTSRPKPKPLWGFNGT